MHWQDAIFQNLEIFFLQKLFSLIDTIGMYLYYQKNQNNLFR